MDRDELNREHNGLANSEESSLSILLFITSGPEDFPSWRFCSISLTSLGFNLIPWIEGVLSLIFNFGSSLLLY